jgi:hypothetical protein
MRRRILATAELPALASTPLGGIMDQTAYSKRTAESGKHTRVAEARLEMFTCWGRKYGRLH